jgi:hypothetical protein
MHACISEAIKTRVKKKNLTALLSIMLMMLVGILLLMLGPVATQHFLGVMQTSPFAASSTGSSADQKLHQTTGVTAPTIHRDLLYGKNVGPTISQDEYYYETCRRFPLWLGNLSEVCKRYSGWVLSDIGGGWTKLTRHWEPPRQKWRNAWRRNFWNT